MSDQYEEYGEYEEYENNDDQNGGYQNNEMQQQVEEDYQTKVQLDFFEAQELLRKNQIEKCITSLEQLYTISNEKQLKNWKVKILNLLLQIYCRSNSNEKIQQTLERISQLNKKQKYTENAIKSIIITIKSLPHATFDSNKKYVYGFINQLDNLGKIKSYLLLLEKAVQENDQTQSEHLFKDINEILSETKDVPANILIQLFSYEIRHSRKTNKDISKEVRKMQLKLSVLESQIYMSQGHISIIKQAVAQNLYIQDNYKDCAMYLCQAFQDNMKYGKNSEIKKNLLKANVLVALLINDKQLFATDKFNALYHESASSFKSQNDVQSLYGMVQAFIECDLKGFQEQSKMAALQFKSPYENLVYKVVNRLKMSKLLQIIAPYTKIKSSYLQRRLDSSAKEIEQMLFALITDNKINGRIRHQPSEKDTYLDINPPVDEFLQIQLENIRQISKRYV